MFKKNKFFSFLITFLMVFNLLIPMGSVFANSENTLTVAEAIANNSGSGTVEGYIVGTTQTQSALGSGVFEGPFTVTTNVLIADNPDERDISKIMPVQLPNNAIRTAVNLVDHPDNLGKKIKVTGDLAAYFSVPGLRNLTGYQFVASGPIDEDPIDRDYITVAEAILNNSGNAVVEGYIVGTTQTSSVIGNGNFDGPFTIRTNLLIADSPDERDITKVLPVQLPNNEIRTATNLVDHPDHLGKKIRFTGTLEAYFGVAGLKTLTAYEFQEEVRDYVTVAEAIENNTGNATVLGYIVGTRNVFDGPFTVNTNIQIADSPFERDLAKTLPIQLPIGNVRNGLNLVDHPDNLGKLVKITGDLSAYFSAPGLRNASAYEFVDGGEVPNPEIPTVTIAEARNMMGRIVITEGIVNVDNGLLQPGRLSVYIQDGDAGIQLFNYSAGIFPEIKEGDSVKVQGRVGEYNGVTQIVVDELTLQERGQVVEVKEVTIAEYVDRNVAEAYEGQLVTLEGYIFTVPSYDNGGVNITIVDEDLNVLIIRAWESTGIDLSQIEANKWYEITAISSEYRGTYQILPRSNADFVVSAVQKDKPFGSGKEIRATVERVVDGDTIRLVDPVFGARNVRYLNIDTLETYHTVRNELDENQMMHGLRAGEYLRTMLSDGDEVILKLGDEPLDGYGRLLAEVFTLDGINTNYEMVLAGHAVTYFIWPFEDDAVLHYGEALQIARQNQLAIWNPEDPMLEYPFEFRARERGDELYRPVGDIRTKYYVEANEWRTVEPEYRVFFNSEEDAIAAGYVVKPAETGEVIGSVKQVVVELHNSKEIYKNSTYNVIVNQINTIENHLEKVKEANNPRVAEAHENNLYRAIEKLNRDLEREFRNGNLSQGAYELILENIKGAEIQYIEILESVA